MQRYIERKMHSQDAALPGEPVDPRATNRWHCIIEPTAEPLKQAELNPSVKNLSSTYMVEVNV